MGYGNGIRHFWISKIQNFRKFVPFYSIFIHIFSKWPLKTIRQTFVNAIRVLNLKFYWWWCFAELWMKEVDMTDLGGRKGSHDSSKMRYWWVLQLGKNQNVQGSNFTWDFRHVTFLANVIIPNSLAIPWWGEVPRQETREFGEGYRGVQGPGLWGDWSF